MSRDDKDQPTSRSTGERREESREERVERQKRTARAIMARYRFALRELAK
jgi:hypothetical protein